MPLALEQGTVGYTLHVAFVGFGVVVVACAVLDIRECKKIQEVRVAKLQERDGLLVLGAGPRGPRLAAGDGLAVPRRRGG